MVACVGALVTELSGIAGVGQMLGIPAWEAMTVTVIGLTLMAYTGSYLTVERIALAIGLFELVFLVVAWQAHPSGAELFAGAINIPFRDDKYLYLAAANIGAVIMPWMVFYQQSAVIEKGLGVEDLQAARWDTAIGAFVTQLIMAAVLIATAATLAKNGDAHPLNTVQDIAKAITPFVGARTGTTLFALGMIGASLVATVVVTLTAARTLGEVMGYKYSLEYRPREAPWFYGVYTLSLILGGVLVASGIDLVKVSVAVQVMNALLLPIVLGFLYLLATRALPPPYQLGRGYRRLVLAVILVTVIFGLYAGLSGIGS
jgi:Mn2+/Fe2+ NRAMP family transporter